MKVITSAVNNPTFIEIQYLTFKKYLKQDFEYIVFNDAKDFPELSNEGDLTQRQQIFDMCNKLGVKCIPIDNRHHHSYANQTSHCHSLTLKEMLKYQLENPDFYILIDFDMFLYDYLDINDFIKYKAAIFLQTRERDNLSHLNWVWPGLLFLNMNHPSEKDYDLLDWGFTYKSDTGGATHNWLMKQLSPNEKLPNFHSLCIQNNIDININSDKIYFFKALNVNEWTEKDMPEKVKLNESFANFIKSDPRNSPNGNIYSEFYHNCFYHYKAGGNWDNTGLQLHLNRALILKDILLS